MLLEISPTHPALLPLFDPQIANHPMLFATLLDHNPGHAFVDDVAAPTQGMVQTNGRLLFFSQQADQSFFDEGVAHIKQTSHVALIWSATAYPRLQIPPADKTIQRLAFPQHDNTASLARFQRPLPAGLALRPLTKELLERCEWREEIESFCGRLDNFVAHGFGLCLMQGDDILSEAYAPFVGQERIEIGVVTNEAHRGKGYGAITCAALIQTCLERGLAPYWSCDADNTASAHLARKLGFHDEHPYEIRLYRGLPK